MIVYLDFLFSQTFSAKTILFISQDATLIAKNTDNPTHKHPNTQAREE
jgi:hypothetical protein